MRATGVTTLAVLCLCAFAGVGAAAPEPGRSVFYLALTPGQCAMRTASTKRLLVVPCSQPRHTDEVFAIDHGGWGRGPTPKIAGPKALTLCLDSYRRLTGHALARTSGLSAFWADPGAEKATYGDKIVCVYRHWPSLAPLGSGRHVR